MILRWALRFGVFDMVYPYACFGTRRRDMLNSIIGHPHVLSLGLLFLVSFLKVHGWRPINQTLWSHALVDGGETLDVFACIAVVFVAGRRNCFKAHHAPAHLETRFSQDCNYRNPFK